MSSVVACVLCESTEKRLVSSTRVTTEQTLVSLKSAMKSLTTGGTTMRTGLRHDDTAQRKRPAHAERERRLHLALGDRGETGAVDLALVGRVVHGEAQDGGPEGGHVDPYLGQEKEDEVELQHHRRSAQELDVQGERRFEPLRPVDPPHGDEEAGQHREGKRETRRAPP